MTRPSLNTAKADKAVAKLRAHCRRLLERKIREMERAYSTAFIAFRIGMHPAMVEELRSGKHEFTFDQLSDLGLAVGIEFDFKVKKAKK